MASSFLARRVFAPSLRRMTTTASTSEFKRHLVEEEVHAGSTWVNWRRISIFVAVPAVLVCAWNAWEKEKEHAAHGRGEFVPYNHLRVRSKPFPWGDGNHSLFHNSHANALPEGYEDEIEE
ncbi:cytochrome c oxidase subunit 6A2, mitochondrial-like [Rhopilema esculentum]|uniref:cytochrome c oxidase subunit 6A2, mitochondrial-like n=1 Tax=Rhopilema esculentum TaxID=499914 RepID=UPI0031DCCAEE